MLIGAETRASVRAPAAVQGATCAARSAREKVYVHAEDFYAEHEIELRLGRTAVSLDTSIGEVGLDDGERLRYDRLLLATGAEPRRLSLPGAELDGVLYLRSVEDSDALRDRLDRGGSLVVVGAGWIGSEVAASARQRGLDVTVVDPHAVPLERVLGTEVGAIYRDIHTDHGVRMLLGNGVEAFEGADVGRARAHERRARRSTATSSSSASACSPRTALARTPASAVDDGILVDEHLQTERARRVRRRRRRQRRTHPFYGERIRVEHWANALHQGPAAARNMLGTRAAYDRLPYFFSDQYDVGMEYAGLAPRLGPRRLPRRPGEPRVHRLLAARERVVSPA